jgi:hypothetical protein
MIRRCLSAACLALVCLPLLAAAPVEKIQALLAKPEVLCGRFEQTKYLAGLKKPLLSSGRFCVAPKKGVLWRTLQPFPNTLRMTRDEIVQTEGERVAMRLDARQEPAVRMINGVLFSLLAGDLLQLETLFSVDGAVRGNGWQVALKPRDATLAKVITGIGLEGDAYLRNITISEPGGDRSSIRFADLVTGAEALNAEEGKLLE